MVVFPIRRMILILTLLSNTPQKMKISMKDFFSKCDQILDGKLHFLCSESYYQTSQL